MTKTLTMNLRSSIKRLLYPLLLMSLYGCTSNTPILTPPPELPPYQLQNSLLSHAPTSDIERGEILALNVRMINFLHKHIDLSAEPEQRVQQLLAAIFAKDKIGLQYRSEPTKTAIGTFESSYGNCLSFANLFVAMARHLGIEANYQELIEEPTWRRKGEVLWISHHINVVGKLPKGQRYTIDFEAYLPYRRNQIAKARMIPDHRAFAYYYSNLGAEALARNESAQAFTWFKKAVAVDSSMALLWSNLGTIYSRNFQFEAAETAFKHALNLEPDSYSTMKNLAKLHLRQGLEVRAEYYVEQAEQLRDHNPYYHFWLGKSAYQLGDYRKAIRHFEAASARKRRTHEFHFALAGAYWRLGQAEQA
ncbi:MAG: tetratricopeptide repeat protein, partial [Pseudomonadota bacterium]